MQAVRPTHEESHRRREVLETILRYTRENQTIKLPDFDRASAEASETYALASVGIEPNDFGGTVGEYRYQFEGEEDLLHLMVTRLDAEKITAEEGQRVAEFLFQGVKPELAWFKPGQYSQHFYIGHDVLLSDLVI